MDTLKTNVVGPAYLAQVLLPFLERGDRKTIVNYSSGLASIGLDFGAKTATYSVTKMAVNMLVRVPFYRQFYDFSTDCGAGIQAEDGEARLRRRVDRPGLGKDR